MFVRTLCSSRGGWDFCSCTHKGQPVRSTQNILSRSYSVRLQRIIFQPFRCLDIGAALQRTVRIDAQDEASDMFDREARATSIPVFHLTVQLCHHTINVERLRTGD